MIRSVLFFKCDHPGCTSISNYAQFASIDDARKAGWAVSRDRVHCYCVRCAPKRRNVGCKGGFIESRDIFDSRKR